MTSDPVRRCSELVLVVVLLVTLATPSRGQERRWSFGVQLGAAVPTAGLSDLEEPGPALEAGAAYALTPRLGATVDGSLAFLLADDALGPDVPDLRLWSYTAGLETLVTPLRTPWTLRIGAGGGLTYVESDAYPASGTDGPVSREFGEVYPSVAAALRVGWRPGSRVDVLAGVGTRVVFFDSTETGALTALAFPEASAGEGFGTSATIPLHLRVRIRL